VRLRIVDVDSAIKREKADPGSVPVMAEYINEAASRKGGSIAYALWLGEQLSQQNPDRSFVAYTDADISTDLLQTGLLVEKMLDGADVTIASTELSDSVMEGKTAGRKVQSIGMNTFSNGLLDFSTQIAAIYHLGNGVLNILGRKAIAPKWGGRITDTQRGFKMFTPKTLRKMMETFTQYPQEMAIDTSLLVQLNNIGARIDEAGIAWKPLEEDSTTRPADGVNMLYRLFTQRIAYVLPRLSFGKRLAATWVVLLAGAYLKFALRAFEPASHPFKGKAINRFKAEMVAMEAKATGKSVTEITAEMNAYYSRAAIGDATAEAYVEEFKQKEMERVSQAEPENAEAIIANLNKVKVKAYGVNGMVNSIILTNLSLFGGRTQEVKVALTTKNILKEMGLLKLVMSMFLGGVAAFGVLSIVLAGVTPAAIITIITAVR